jgi:hypothetical protein
VGRAISKRRPQNVVTITLANKMARAIWALLAYDRSYVRGYPSEHAIDMLFAPAVYIGSTRASRHRARSGR